MRALGRRCLFAGAVALPVVAAAGVAAAVAPAPSIASSSAGRDLVAANKALHQVVKWQAAEINRLRGEVGELIAKLERMASQVRWAANDADLADTAANDPEPAAS